MEGGPKLRGRGHGGVPGRLLPESQGWMHWFRAHQSPTWAEEACPSRPPELWARPSPCVRSWASAHPREP